MREVAPPGPEAVASELDRQAWQVFQEAIALLGGPRGLVEHKRLTWLPSLMEAAYAVVLREAGHRSPDDIAHFLGLSTAAVRQILAASPEQVLARLEAQARGEGDWEAQAHRTHVAGGLAKLAWRRLQEATQG